MDWSPASWFLTSWSTVLMVFLSAVGFYGVLVLFTRLTGLRSFSKMSSFDFAITVAFGSLTAAVVADDTPSLLQGVAALGSLFLIQYVVAELRRRSDAVNSLFDNDPILLMVRDEILYDNLAQAQITVDDLRAKLREANVINMDQVCAVVMETTGDVSVLHSEDEHPDFDPKMLNGVRGAEAYTQRTS